MMHIYHIFSPDAFPGRESIDETDFYYYHYMGDLSFVFDEGKISVKYVTLGDVCVQLRDICLELEKECSVKHMLEFTEGEGIITFERKDETIFIHPDFIPSESGPYVSPAPKDYGFHVPLDEFHNAVKKFYSSVADEIWASNTHTKKYLPEWEN